MTYQGSQATAAARGTAKLNKSERRRRKKLKMTLMYAQFLESQGANLALLATKVPLRYWRDRVLSAERAK